MGILQDSGLVVIGAVVALGPNLLTERLKTRQAERAYWRDQRRLAYTQFLGHTSQLENDTVRIGRLVRELVAHDPHPSDTVGFRHPELIDDPALKAAIAERNAGAELVTDGYETIKLIGSPDAVDQARAIMAALNQLLEMARGGRFEADHAWPTARRAVRDGRERLRSAAREDLGVAAA